MALSYRIEFHMRDPRHDIQFTVREPVWQKIADIFDKSDECEPRSCIVIRTVDGMCVAINLAEVQAVSHLSDAVIAPPDNSVYDDAIQIQLKGRERPFEERTEDDVSLADLIMALERGPDIVPVVRLLDEDGEMLRVKAAEIVYVIAPAVQVDAGYRAIENDE